MVNRAASTRLAFRPWVVALAWFALAGAVQAADYAESSGGDLSGDRLAPTTLLLDVFTDANVPGSNVVSGTIGRMNGIVDRDYLRVVVPAGHLWSELRVGNQTVVGGSGSFIGLAAGSVMPVAPDAANAAGLLGFRIFGIDDRNSDILPALGVAGNGAAGFSAPLPAGDYTVWIQELAEGSFQYRLNFVITPVPEPSVALLWGLGFAVLAGTRLRATRSNPRA